MRSAEDPKDEMFRHILAEKWSFKKKEKDKQEPPENRRIRGEHPGGWNYGWDWPQSLGIR